ncbi:MAG: hypothetical protein J5614_04055 [Paludibacteraceae bacterium]|nr:hypothetical protein [Paludibacteraceae bacterium]
MKPLFLIVRDLLCEHSLVIVPGLGGFVCNKASARIDKKSGKFTPPSVEVLFNQRLQHNDGLLQSALVETEGLSANDAEQLIKDEVARVMSALAKEHKFDLSGLGVLEKDGRNIIFHSQPRVVENVDAYGLQEFYFPELDEAEVERRNVYRPTEKSTGFSVIAAAAVLLFCFFAQPVHRDSINSYQASLILDTPCNWVSSQSVEKVTKYSVVLSRFETKAEADSFAVQQQMMVNSDTVRVIEQGDEYLAVFSETDNWKQVISSLYTVRDSMTNVVMPFVLCREVEVE